MKILDNHDFTNFQNNVKSFSYIQESPQKNNKPIIYILCAPRTGSTLLRIMLASHRKLFSPQELFLLPYSNMSERNSEFSGYYKAWHNGLINAVMNIFNIRAEKATVYIEKESKKETDIKSFYKMLQNAIDNRVLVDKSTTNAFSINYLKKIPKLFSKVKYIHLTRHPYGMINSFDKSVTDLIKEYKIMLKNPAVKYTKIEFAELLWTICNTNICKFLNSMDNENIYKMRYEDLVYKPELELQRLSKFLNLDFDRNMLTPYGQSATKVMTNGINDNTLMVGAKEYYKYKKIETENVNKWMTNFKKDCLSKETLKLSKTFSYESIEELESKKQKYEIVNLPFDGRRIKINNQEMGDLIATIDYDLVKTLDDNKTGRFIEINDAYLPALLILLRRYGGQDRIVIGSVVKTSEVISIKCSFDAETKVSDVISQIEKSKRHGVNAKLSNLKFQVLLIENDNEDKNNLLISENNSALSFVISEEKNKEVTVKFNSFLFKTETIERMSKHFINILVEIITKSDQVISRIDFLGREEKQKLLVDWNDTQHDYASEKTLVHLFEAQVERSPDAIAVAYEDQKLTYTELNRRANKLAHYLRMQGVVAESRVGIWIDRSPDMMVVLLGTLKAGGAYVPLDPDYPQERLEFMLKDSQAPVLLTREKFLKDLPAYSGHVVCIDRDFEAIADRSEDNPISEITPDSAAYVIYTSGSTGTPKGVMGLHRGAVNRLSWMWRVYPFKDDEVCCQKTYLSFLDSVWEIFGPLLKGVPAVIMSEEVVKDSRLLVDNLAAAHVSRIVLVPSLLRVLVDSFGDLQKRLFHLKIWVTSGEEISVELAQHFGQVMPEAKLINLYGSSEVSADVTCYEVAVGMKHRCIPIGRPIDNTSIYILDSDLQLVPIGVPGELYIGGVGLARGYLNQPHLTAERFIPSPHAQGEVLFKTGDLGRYLPDGNIEYLNRVDNQVQVRGFRIELGEIETVLSEHDAIEQGVVAVREEQPGDTRIVAYFVSKPDRDIVTKELRSHLRAKLPDYMIPQHFVDLELMPLTPAGKVDRKALPKPEVVGASEQGYKEPRSEIEKGVAEIWREVLKLKRVGIYDDFFELGGHSLLATQVLSRLSDVFQVEIPLRQLFFYPTLVELSQLIAGKLEKTEPETVKKLLDEFDNLSDEEAERLLAQELHQNEISNRSE